MSDRIGTMASLAALVLALGGYATVARAQAPWPEESWNPRPLPDDLVLPLPCNGAIVFRPVPTPIPKSALADRQTTLGWSNAETDYAEYLRQAFLAGGFSGATADAPPRYFMAKYEVTTDQFSAVADGDCSKLPTPAGRQPKSNVAWYEAVAYTAKLSSWLAKNAKDKLPPVDGDDVAFVRLPTEDEWEYAARGGTAVGEAEFSAQAFPMPLGVLRYAWFQGTRSAGGNAHPIGQLEPNPLGLFDILGNLAEWTLEPFRMNKVGRPHGLAGAQTVRGGDFATPEDQLRSALRFEMPAINPSTGDHYRTARIGLRPVLARTASPSDDRIQETRQAFAEESKSHAVTAEDPLRLLEALRQQSAEPATKGGLTRIETTLRTANRELKERETQALRRVLQSSAHLARQIGVELALQEALTHVAKLQVEVVAEQHKVIDDQARLTSAFRDEGVRRAFGELRNSMQALARTYETIQRSLAGYVDKQLPAKIESLTALYLRNVAAAGAMADKGRIADEAKVVLQEFEAQSLAGALPAFSKLATTHILAAANGKVPTVSQIENDVRKTLDSLARPQPTPPAPPSQRR